MLKERHMEVIMHHRKGFTLSDVLITLGVIAVVAAMTIPTLIKGVQDIQYKSAYKKAFSAASQALAMANQQYLLAAATGEGDYTNHMNNFLAFKDQFKVVKECLSWNNSQCWNIDGDKYGNGFPQEGSYAFIDVSGMTWSMYWSGSGLIFVDTNGLKKPNKWGKDRFGIRLVGVENKTEVGLPTRVLPFEDGWLSVVDYYGTSWLYN
ncbi:MAG: hypothetical protein WCY19_08815 [Candidatus Gastranaerophilaceae bacterium]